MIRTLFAALALFAGATAVAAPPAAPAPIEVLVLGSYHMGNPGQDVHNARVDPVTAPAKQGELRRLAEALARFRPTLIAVERVAPDQTTLLDPRYAAFRPADLLSDADERVQIAYRLAHRLRLPRVHAIDEQSAAGEPDYFPFDKVQAFAAARKRGPELERAMAFGAEQARTIETLQSRGAAHVLLWLNDPARIALEQTAGYYGGMLPFGAGRDLPGAEVNGRWYTRNAKIFAKLMQVARPGDRVLVVYGAGHNYWLRHFAASVPGYRLVEATPYLHAAR